MVTQHSNETEISQLQQYITHVQHAVLSAPDERTQMLRSFVLALAESRLANLLEQSNDNTANLLIVHQDDTNKISAEVLIKV